ncbi:MAG: hypothetical protein MR266_05345 [Erysipelotrichaceae bacterium]|nr:hypothetical protein [Erysipelotrichaceae bacterium]
MKSRLEKNKKKINEIDKEKRQKKAKIIIKITSIILVSIFSLLCFSMFIGAKYLVVKEVKITNDKLPNSFHGLKMVQFSDLLYPSFNEKDLDNLKNKINELKPDIIVFTGNIKRIDYELTKNDISILSKFFNSLESSMNKYAVYGTNDKNFLDILENSFIILDNKESIIYNKEIENIKIIGFNSNNVDTSKISDGSNYNICLINNPDNINKIKDVCDLTLAGNTLGGEIKIPFYKGLLTNNKYYKEYYKGYNMYISNGIGNNYKVRLFNQPSISLYRLNKY